MASSPVFLLAVRRDPDHESPGRRGLKWALLVAIAGVFGSCHPVPAIVAPARVSLDEPKEWLPVSEGVSWATDTDSRTELPIAMP
jgi:hypothetical protein